MKGLDPRSLAALIVCAAPALAVHAQSVPYDITVGQASYTPLTGGGVTHYTPIAYVFGLPAWDEGAAEVPLPFTFSWFGRPYDAVYVYTNGFLSFEPPPPGPNNILGAPSLIPDSRNVPHNFIAALWQDLDGGMNPDIRSVTAGAQPNRRIIIEVTGMKRARAVTSAVAFQVRIEESGSVIISYDPAQNNGVTQATIAIEDASGVLGTNLLTASASCGAGCSCAARACSSANVTVANPTDARSITIRPPTTAELIGAVSGPSGAYPNDPFSAYVQVFNVGLASAAATQASLVLSTDAVIDGTDTLLTTIAVPMLAAGATFSSTVTTTMPGALPVGRFFLGLIVDTANAVSESVETNNAARDPQGIVTGPDLTATVFAPLNSGPGETLDLTFALRSNGAEWTQPIAVTFSLSEDAVLDAGDREILSTSYSLPDGFRLDRTVSIVVPLDVLPRSYRVIASIDPLNVVREIDEANNIAITPTNVTMTLPDLDPVELTAGPAAFRGLAYPIRARVANRGGSAARNFTVCAVISRNPLISTVSDPILVRTAPMTLAGGEDAAIRVEPIIPVSTGTGAWYLALVADCDEAVTESNEPNNSRRRMDQIIILDPAPDFTPIAISTSSSAAAGEPVLTSVTIANYGPAAGAARVRLVLSETSVASPMDRVIYDGMMPIALDPGRETTLGLTGDIPGDVGSGRYFIGAILDPLDAVMEVDETNNVLTSHGLVILGSDLGIVSPAPPSGIQGVPYTWRFFAGGGDPSLPTTWTATWMNMNAPPGLMFDMMSGQLSGTPSATGMFTLEIEVRRGPLVARSTYPFLVTPPTLPLSCVSSKLPPAILMEEYRTTLIAVGGTPPYTWGPQNPAPGTNLMLGPQDGVLQGEPTVEGAFNFRATVTDALGTRATCDLALDVVDLGAGISISTTDLPSGAVGEAYDIPLRVEGGTAPYTWLYEGEIPGLMLDANAHLVGTPLVAGSYPVTIEVRDSRGLLDRNAYIVRIFELGELAILTGRTAETQLPKGKIDVPYTADDGAPVTLRAARRNGAPIEGLRWVLAIGELPPGVRLNDATGVFEGTPTAAGAFAFTVMAFDATNDRDRATLVIVVENPLVVPPPPEEGCGCTTGSTSGGLNAVLVLLAVAIARRRRSAAVFALVLVASTAQAQPIPYSVTTEIAPYIPLPAANRLAPDLGDGGTARIALPFDLRLYGAIYREVYVNANGVVFALPVGAGQHFPPIAVPDLRSPNGFVAGLWGDWCAGSNIACGGPQGPPDAGIYTRIDSTPGARNITIEYRSLRHFADFVTPSDINFQIKLHEGAGERIELHYGAIIPGESFAGSPTFLSARIGVESVDAAYGTWISPCDGLGPCENADLVTLAGTRITLLADAGEDVAITGLVTPDILYPGLVAPITARYTSRHGSPLGPARVAVYLLDAAATSTVGGRLLTTSAPIVLGAYESRELALDALIPGDLAPGRQILAVVADASGALAETDEDNNTVFTTPLRVTDRAPDLAVQRVSPLDARALPGASLRVAYTIANVGNERATSTARVYASSNEAVTTADRVLGDPITLDLAIGASATGTITVMVPLDQPVGPAYVGIIADDTAALVELDETNNIGRAPNPVVFAGEDVVFLTQDLPAATLTAAYQARIVAVGGDREPTLRLTRGALPRGVLFAADRGELFGVPLETGTFPIDIEASSNGRTASRTFQLVVVTPDVPLTIVSRDLPIGVLGSDYVAIIRFIGGTGPFGLRVLGTLPPGIEIATNGALVGVPRQIGSYPFGLELRDNASHTATIGLSIDVRAPGNLTVLDAELPDGKVGEMYSGRVQAIGGTPPYRWTALRALPAGFEISELGEIVGTPNEIGSFTLSLKVEDDAGAADTNNFTVDVEAKGRLAILVDRLEKATVGVPYRALLRVEGGIRPFTWLVVEQEGALPPGIAALPGDPAQNESTNDLALAGTLAEAGAWAFTVRLRDAQGLTVERALVIESVLPPPPPPPEESGCRCVSSARSRSSAYAALAAIGVLALARRRRPSC